MHLWPISSHCIIHLLIYSAKLHSCLIISSIIYCIQCVFFDINASDFLAAINLSGTVTQTMENRLVVFQYTLNYSLSLYFMSLSLFSLSLCYYSTLSRRTVAVSGSSSHYSAGLNNKNGLLTQGQWERVPSQCSSQCCVFTENFTFIYLVHPFLWLKLLSTIFFWWCQTKCLQGK